jgi:hypothetical protein
MYVRTTQALNYLREPGEDGFMLWLLKSNEAQRAQEVERKKQHQVEVDPRENGGGGVREPALVAKRESRL